MIDNILGGIVIFLLGGVFGWIFAHSTVATECEKLNSFYVGNRTFHCEIKK